MHSNIVGGSTAKRVIACPGSVPLVQQMPPKPSSEYADRGTMLHNIISEILEKDLPGQQFIGTVYEGIIHTQELHDEKIVPALDAIDEIDPGQQMVFKVESLVDFGDLLPGVFGSADLIGRLGDRAIVLDWKFGDGVAVEATENEQLMFYAAAAMRTKGLEWAFAGASEVELIIVQPPAVKRWVTSLDRIQQFEQQLVMAVHKSAQPDAKLTAGEHCRWCAAKPICPLMTGEVDRALHRQLDSLPAEQIGQALEMADRLEGWISDLRALAFQMLENGKPVPGYKLVPKRALRQWVSDDEALTWLQEQGVDATETKVISPAKAEKLLKKSKTALPDNLVVAVSSGTTMAAESDPRPAVVDLSKMFSKLKGN